MTIKIETGKFYRTRDGRKVGPMGLWGYDYFDCEPAYYGEFWQSDGTHGNHDVDQNTNLDLVTEWKDEFETGTLHELNLMPGDVVECIDHGVTPHHMTKGKYYTILAGPSIRTDEGELWGEVGDVDAGFPLLCQYRIDSRFIDRAMRPKLWRDMTPEEKGALLLAQHEEKEIEVYSAIYSEWAEKIDCEWRQDMAYRVRPEPKRETVTLWAHYNGKDVPVGKVDLLDGKPDLDSLVM